MELALALMFLGTWVALLTARLRTYMQAFQQEEYDASRFATWWVEKHAWDRYATRGLAAAAALSFVPPLAPFTPLAAASWLGWRLYKEPNPTRTGKKPLVMTPRARNIWAVATALALPAAVASTFLPQPWGFLAAIVAVQALPLALPAANLLLAPFQAWRNRRYLAECSQILNRLKPKVVGITGSFGKTSTKYVLGHILAAHRPTLMTPGSTNTPLGIARVVREQLRQQHAYFLAEMGAYGPGSIARLCRLAPPDVACITAVGDAHYERFKSLETVAQAKFEIAEATLHRGGICVLSVDGIPAHLWKPRVAANPHGYRLVGQTAEDLRAEDYYVKSFQQTPQGLKLTVGHGGKESTFQTPLFGTMQVGNLATAFALAMELGVPAATILAAMANAPAAPHRLNVRADGQGKLIDDSYNSNPKGFAAALEILTLIGKAEKRRRVLVTPGMVELGAKHDEEHARLGKLAAENADVILAIGPERIPTFIKAVEEAQTTTHSATQLHQLPSLAQAQNWLKAQGHATDVILIENDLPDRYESPWQL